MKVKSLLAILNILHDEDSECMISVIYSVIHEESSNGTLLAVGRFDNLSMKSFRNSPFNSIDIISSDKILIYI